MGVEVVHHQDDLLGFWKRPREVIEARGEVFGGAPPVLTDEHVSGAEVRQREDESAYASLAHVFVIVAGGMPAGGGDGQAGFG